MRRLLFSRFPNMATLPRRNYCASATSSKLDSSPFQILVQMGFPKKRALKALAATGNRSVQLASDWLLTHVNDTSLDADEPREYVLYVNPTGQLLRQIHDFREKSKAVCGWNGALNFPPHITLVPFFKAADEESLHLAKALKLTIEKVGQPPVTPLKLETYISPNFIGLFMCDEFANYFKEISLQYAKQTSKCTNLESRGKSLHMTLAYQFDVAAFEPLKSLVCELKFPDESNWELRLYSRDPRFADHQVYKVVKSYTPKACDELELVIGDYIYVEQSQFDSSTDGWVHGTSWLTGVAGFLPGVYLQRTAESDAWTLHRAINLGPRDNMESKSSDLECKAEGEAVYPHEDALGLGQEKSEETYKEWEKYWHEVQNSRSESILRVTQGTSIEWKCNTCPGVGDSENSMVNSETSSEGPKRPNDGRRWIFAMRHGERVDLTYGAWVNYCFDENETYIRKDLNMPLKLAERAGGVASYARDTPLTRVGWLQAHLVGEGLRLAGVTVQHVYASAALRCVETAHAFLEGLQADPCVKINVEPGLFEFKEWYSAYGMAPFMTPRELHKAGYNVDLKYKPYVELDTNSSESLNEMYKRNELVMHSAVRDTTSTTGGNIIFIGHAATLDLMVYAMKRYTKKPVEPVNYQISKNLLRVPYCALGAMRDKPWQVVSPPCPPLLTQVLEGSIGEYSWMFNKLIR